MAAQKKDFTYKDLKEAFLAGERIGYGHVGFERWIRSAHAKRYVRKPKARKAA
jgi:hypothetical protein